VLNRKAWGGRAALTAALLAALGAAASATTADHHKFAALKKNFKDGPEVTRACLVCHTEAASQIQNTAHWHWLGDEVSVPGHAGKHRLGKANVLNNFCIGIRSNEATCTKCHVSFGMTDIKKFDYSRSDNVDCIGCHDGSGKYAKGEAGSEKPDFSALAQSVGRTSVRTCGACHFNGGGGEGVKHGDLDASLLDADKTLDVHMAKNGMGFTCATCHKGEDIGHSIKGRNPGVSVDSATFVTCAGCHGDAPHGAEFSFRTELERVGAGRFAANSEKFSPWQSQRRNWHSRRVACQTCHIPTFAREHATKMTWDWSTAGRHKPDGRPVMEYDEDGNISYWGIKGTFTWAKNVVPKYRWWNGTSERYLAGDKFDPAKVLVLNPPLGGPRDPGSKIWPFKLHEGKQPFDPVNRILIQPHLSGKKGSGAFWADYEWDVAAKQGMKAANLPFSGKIAFTRTDMYWPISHMVTQGDHGLSCMDCHSRNSRLAGVGGVYIPGYDRSAWLDLLGWLSAGLSLLGVLGHGFLRWLGSRGMLGRFLDAIGARRRS
jgi:hypothetical protein